MRSTAVPEARFPDPLDLPDVWAAEPVAQLDALLNATHSTWTDHP